MTIKVAINGYGRIGRNVLRAAIINGPGLSDFCVRFVDEAGKPIRDISVDVK